MNRKKTVETKEEVLRYYERDDVVKEYVRKRFFEPLNAVEHQQQVKILNYLIKKTNSRDILEFASGPARVTADIEAQGGVSIENSQNMIHLAEKKMKEKNKAWTFQQGDIFALRLNRTFDLIFSMRFFLHFKYADRSKLYLQTKKFLKKDGYLVFEVMNRNTVLPLRKLLGRQRYFVYDKLYTKAEFTKEMCEHGFKVLKFYPVLSHFWWQTFLSRPFKLLHLFDLAQKLILLVEHKSSTNPYEWVVLCQKK